MRIFTAFHLAAFLTPNALIKATHVGSSARPEHAEREEISRSCFNTNMIRIHIEDVTAPVA